MSRSSVLKMSLVGVLLAVGVFAADAIKVKDLNKGKADASFVEDAANSNLAEVKMSEMAMKQSSTAAVKDLAQTMITDHTKAFEALKTMATGKGFAVPGASEKKFDDLATLSGQKFDRAFLSNLIDDHKKAISLFEHESKSGDDSEFKAWATNTLPTLKHHLEMAQAVEKDLKKSSM
jgi:putative membrane protein